MAAGMCAASAFWTYALSQVEELMAVLSGTLTLPAACPEPPDAAPPPDDEVVLPTEVPVGNHLRLQVHDIIDPMDGYVTPQIEHVERLLHFVQRWRRDAPMVIHCYAGISRSTAAAFATVKLLVPAGT